MDEIQQNQTPDNIPKRPTLLTVLCILTFIGSGINLFSSLVVSLFYETFRTVATSIVKTMKIPGMEMILSADRLFFITSAIIYATAIAGAVKMFQLKRIGFHLYTIAQILLILSPMFFFKLNGPSVFFDILLSGIFVTFYSYYLKLME